jgi:topoisomerase-4 subunit A
VRIRAKWEKEDTGRGTYQIVVTEIPYQVKKSDLVEQLADLIDSKKAALLGDVRDESAEDIRLVLEPKSKNVEPEVLMESLFKLSALEAASRSTSTCWTRAARPASWASSRP